MSRVQIETTNINSIIRSFNRSNNTQIITSTQTLVTSYQAYLPFIRRENPIPTYYVSTNGDDSNPGTFEKPWRTISKASRMAFPGLQIYIRGGIYNEVVEVRASGTESQPISFIAFPGEVPIIDGNNELPTNWIGLFSIHGDWIRVSGIETRNSKYDGFGLYGHHDIANKVYAHHCQYHGAFIMGDFSTVQNSRFWRNSLMNEYGASGDGSSALYAAHDDDGNDIIAEYATIRNNIVWENWGEGISTSNANHIVIDNNTSHDNYAANIYVTDSTNILVQNNFVYMNPDSYVYGYGANVGIMMGDEEYNPPSANITIINNIAYSNNRNLYWWRGVQGGGMVNVLIANNTFVNSFGTSGIIFMPGAHQNVQIINNIIQQIGDLPVIKVDDPTGITFSNNLWSKTPPPNYPNPLPPGDIVSDPLFIKIGEPYLPQWYLLSNLSPAIDNSIILSEVAEDFFENPRGDNPDIGGTEYINYP